MNTAKKAAIGCGIFVALIMLLGVGLIYLRSLNPFMDDGPFHGEECKQIPKNNPDQIFSIWNGMTLKSYYKKGSMKAPVVILENKDGAVLWCIYATGMEKTEVRSIRFHKSVKILTFRPRVIAMVDWTYGNEAAWFFIKKNGTLEEYWYSW